MIPVAAVHAFITNPGFLTIRVPAKERIEQRMTIPSCIVVLSRLQPNKDLLGDATQPPEHAPEGPDAAGSETEDDEEETEDDEEDEEEVVAADGPATEEKAPNV